jgi:sec-independent protein translocase protein TatC
VGDLMSEKNERDKELNIWDHLTELSARLRIIFYSVIISTVLMMALPGNLDFLKNPLEYYTPLVAVILNKIKIDIIGRSNIQIIGLSLTAPLELYMIASLVFGIMISTPIIAYEIYKYIDPALHEHERRALYPFIASFSILFLVGVIFAYTILAPFVIQALYPFFTAVGALPVISVTDFYNLVFVFCLASGFTFTIPVFFVLLVKYGILSTNIITKNRKYTYAALFIITAVATPDGGIPGDLLLFIPMVILMEGSVFVGRHFEKQREKQERQKQSS